MLITALGLMLGAAGEGPSPLRPQGSWQIGYNPKDCSMARNFVGTTSPTLVGWRTLPGSEHIDIYVVPAADVRRDASGKVTVALPDKRHERTMFVAVPGGYVISVKRALFTGLSDDAVVRI